MPEYKPSQYKPSGPVDPVTGKEAAFGGEEGEIPDAPAGPSPGTPRRLVEKDPPVNLTFDDDQHYLYTDLRGSHIYVYDDDAGDQHKVTYVDRGDGSWRVYHDWYDRDTHTFRREFTDPPYGELIEGQQPTGVNNNIYTALDPNDPNPPDFLFPPRLLQFDLTLSNVHSESFPDDDRTHSYGTDQYGRTWHWATKASGSSVGPHEDLRYRDTNGLWHEYYEKDGNWHDTWTREDGTKVHVTEDAQGNTINVERDISGQDLSAVQRQQENQLDLYPDHAPLPPDIGEGLGLSGPQKTFDPYPGPTPSGATRGSEAEEIQAKQRAEELERYEQAQGSQNPQPAPPPSGGAGGSESPPEEIPSEIVIEAESTEEITQTMPPTVPGYVPLPPDKPIGDVLLGGSPKTYNPPDGPRLVEEPAPAPPVPDPEPMQTLDAALLDPTAPGPTLDHGLVERIEQNPQLVDAVNQNQDVARALERDPTSIDQIEQDLGFAEPSSDTGPTSVTGPAGVTDLGLTEPPVPEPGPPGQDIDDVTS